VLDPVSGETDLACRLCEAAAVAGILHIVGARRGNIVIDAAVPLRNPAPAEATQAAPISAIDAVWVGVVAPFWIMSAILACHLATHEP